MSKEFKDVSEKPSSSSLRDEISFAHLFAPVVIEKATGEIACTSGYDISESIVDVSNRPHATNDLLTTEKISNVSDKARISSSCDEILIPVEMETGTGEIECTSAADISESIKDVSNRLQAIADRINRHGKTHKEDCFSIQMSDENSPSIQTISKSLEIINTVFNADIAPNKGRTEIFFYYVPWYTSTKYYKSQLFKSK